MWAGILGVVESLVRPLMIALGLWKVKQAGRQEAEHEQAEAAHEAVVDRLEAERAVARADDSTILGMLSGEDTTDRRDA